VKNITETEVKYLAGLFDADATLVWNISKDNVARIHLVFTQKEDRFMRLKPLLDKIGGKTYPYVSEKVWLWQLTKRADIEQLLPRLIKHMIIKGKHWNRLLERWRQNRGKSLSDLRAKALRRYSKLSREDVGPLKPKNRASWGWLSGFLDGDGCYTCRYYKSRNQWQMFISSQIAARDSIALDMLKKSLGGDWHINNRGYAVWHRGCSKGHSAFVFRYLPKLLRHSRMKRHQIEKLIHTLRQRLSEKTPMGEAIV